MTRRTHTDSVVSKMFLLRWLVGLMVLSLNSCRMMVELGYYVYIVGVNHCSLPASMMTKLMRDGDKIGKLSFQLPMSERKLFS